MINYFRQLLDFGKSRLAGNVILVFVTATLEGVGLLLLIPLLGLVGITGAQQTPAWLKSTATIIQQTGITPGLPLALFAFCTLVCLQAWLVRKRDLNTNLLKLEFVDSLRKELFLSLSRSQWTFLTGIHSSNTTNVLTSDIQRVGLGTHFLMRLLTIMVMMLAYLYVALRLSPTLTLVALGAGLTLWLLLRSENHKAAQSGQQLSNSNRNVHKHLLEHLGSMRLIKAHGHSQAQINTFNHFIDNQKETQVQFQRSYSQVQMLYKMLGALSLAALTYLSIEILALPTAELLVLIVLFSRLLPMLSQLQGGYQHLLHMLPAFDAWQQLINDCRQNRECIEEGTSPVRLTNEITLNHIRFNYPRSKFVLDIEHLPIRAKRITAITGESGSGKSTLVDLLLGLHLPQQGVIRIDDTSLDASNLDNWRKHIAYVPQDTLLFDASIADNLAWGNPKCSEDDIWQVLELVAMKDRVTNLPDQLHTRMGEKGAMFSGGERQRLSLARALLRKPDLLILDEATSSLDSDNEQIILDTLHRLKGSLTTILITHRSESLKLADSVVVLENGRMIHHKQNMQAPRKYSRQ